MVVPNAPELEFSASQSFTLSMWVSVPSLPSRWSGIVTKSRDQYPWYGLWIDPSNQWEFGGSPLVPVTLGRHYLAVVQDGPAGIRTFYLDGVAVASGPAVDGNGPGDLWIGGSNSVSEFFNGEVASLAIWNIALSSNQVVADMTATLTGNEPGLQAYYPLNEGSGVIVHDLTANHHDGTLETANGSSLPSWGQPEIDLGDDGTTVNGLSPRQGPNNLQNYPYIVTSATGQLEGWLSGSKPDTTFHIDVFASASFGPGGAGEAQDYLGSLDVTTDAQGDAQFNVPFTPPPGLPVVTATATDPQGNTSEVTATRRPPVVESELSQFVFHSAASMAFSAELGDSISLVDADHDPFPFSADLTLAVSAGTLIISDTAGLTGSGDDTSLLQYSGSLASLNVALERLRFVAPTYAPAEVTLTITASFPGSSPTTSELTLWNQTVPVTTVADSGDGSLRNAIITVNADADPRQDTIAFDIPGFGRQTIAPSSPLPPITHSVLIDGFAQPGYAGSPLIELSGPNPAVIDGLTITGSGVTIRGLAIDDFSSGAAIVISGPGATGNWVYGNIIDPGPFGFFDYLPNNVGVKIQGGASRNLIGTNGDGLADLSEQNIVSGNFFAGVWITGQGTDGNVVAGNLIGTDTNSVNFLDNGTRTITDSAGNFVGAGVVIDGGASSNRIGTDGAGVDDVAERNVISGNSYDGVEIAGAGTNGNIVAGNFIGTDVTGTSALKNGYTGVAIFEGASSNWVGVSPYGGPDVGDLGNVISGKRF